MISGLIAIVTAAALHFAELPFWFTLVVIGGLIAGYLGIDAQTWSELPSPYNTPMRTGIQRIARRPLNTSTFVLLVLVLGLVFIAIALGGALLFSH